MLIHTLKYGEKVNQDGFLNKKNKIKTRNWLQCQGKNDPQKQMHLIFFRSVRHNFGKVYKTADKEITKKS